MTFDELALDLIDKTNNFTELNGAYKVVSKADVQNAETILRTYYQNVDKKKLDYTNNDAEGIDYVIRFDTPLYNFDLEESIKMNEDYVIKPTYRTKGVTREDVEKYAELLGLDYETALRRWKRIQAPESNYERVLDRLEPVDEAIEKHDTLNPKLWDGNQLKPEVEEKLREIVQKFDDNLKENDVELDVKDICIIGSNANYNYSPDSDIDLHIVADTSVYPDQEDLAMKVYLAYKSLFNNKYDPTINGVEVEIYVEPDAIQANSNGIYSLNGGWLKEPEQVDVPQIDPNHVQELIQPYEDRYNDIINSSDATLDDVDNLIDDIYLQRQRSIMKDGEFGDGNICFKEFRNRGYLQNLRDLKVELENKEMSLNTFSESLLSVMGLNEEDEVDLVPELKNYLKVGDKFREPITGEVIEITNIDDDIVTYLSTPVDEEPYSVPVPRNILLANIAEYYEPIKEDVNEALSDDEFAKALEVNSDNAQAESDELGVVFDQELSRLGVSVEDYDNYLDMYKRLDAKGKNVISDKIKSFDESLTEDITEYPNGLEFSFSDPVSTLEVYLQWEGIIGYDWQIIEAYEDGGYDGLSEYLDEEGIYGYTEHIIDILEGEPAYCSQMEMEDFESICRHLYISPEDAIAESVCKNVNESESYEVPDSEYEDYKNWLIKVDKRVNKDNVDEYAAAGEFKYTWKEMQERKKVKEDVEKFDALGAAKEYIEDNKDKHEKTLLTDEGDHYEVKTGDDLPPEEDDDTEDFDESLTESSDAKYKLTLGYGDEYWDLGEDEFTGRLDTLLKYAELQGYHFNDEDVDKLISTGELIYDDDNMGTLEQGVEGVDLDSPRNNYYFMNKDELIQELRRRFLGNEDDWTDVYDKLKYNYYDYDRGELQKILHSLKKEKEANVKESLDEDTVKQNGKWVNKGKEGTHGKFKTKKAADNQRKAMFANGYHEDLNEDIDQQTKKLASRASSGYELMELIGTRDDMAYELHKEGIISDDVYSDFNSIIGGMTDDEYEMGYYESLNEGNNDRLKEILSIPEVKEYVDFQIDHAEYDKYTGDYDYIDITADTDFDEIANANGISDEDRELLYNYMQEQVYNEYLNEDFKVGDKFVSPLNSVAVELTKVIPDDDYAEYREVGTENVASTGHEGIANFFDGWERIHESLDDDIYRQAFRDAMNVESEGQDFYAHDIEMFAEKYGLDFNAADRVMKKIRMGLDWHKYFDENRAGEHPEDPVDWSFLDESDEYLGHKSKLNPTEKQIYQRGLQKYRIKTKYGTHIASCGRWESLDDVKDAYKYDHSVISITPVEEGLLLDEEDDMKVEKLEESEVVSEGAADEIAAHELKAVVADEIYDVLVNATTNLAQEISSRVEKYDIDWCNDDGTNFSAERVETALNAAARALADDLFKNAPREIESNESLEKESLDGNEELAEDVDPSDPKAKALAEFEDVDLEDIDQEEDGVYLIGNSLEYFVGTEEEAHARAVEEIKGLFDDMGLEAFTPQFQKEILMNCIDEDAADEFVESELDYFRNDEPDEDMVNYLENLTDKLQYVEDTLGPDTFAEWAKDKIDLDAMAEEAIKQDGEAHFIAFYDGNEIDLGNGLFAYRMN